LGRVREQKAFRLWPGSVSVAEDRKPWSSDLLAISWRLRGWRGFAMRTGMGMRVRCFAMMLTVIGGGLALPARGVEDSAATLRAVARAAREGDLEGIEPLRAVHDSKAGEAVVRMIEDRKVPDAAKRRIAALVAQWPETSLDSFAFYLRTHDKPSDAMFRFVAELGCARFQPLFLNVLASLKGRPAAEIKEPARAAVALRALARLGELPEDAVAQIAGLMDEGIPHTIRASAADGLGCIKSRRGLAALAARVQDDTLGEAAQRALFRLTGQDFGGDAAKWTAWLKENGGRVELKMLSEAAWDTHQKLKSTAEPARARPQEFSARFYGMEVKGRHCLFVLDCSGSMAGERIGRLKEEINGLLAAFEGRPKTLRFAIILFHTDVEGCFSGRGLMPNDAESLKRAAKYVEKMTAGGATAMMSALQFIAAKLLPAGDVDTIYLLSDGAPTDAPAEAVLAAAKKIYEDFHVKFHTIGIGESESLVVTQDRPPSLLEQIAKATGGIYVAR